MKIAKLLIMHGADVNNMEGRPLFTAINSENLDVVKMLIAHGANVNARNDSVIPYLINAVYVRNLDIVKILISHGADVNAKNSKGKAPLDIARREGFAEIEALLSKTMKDN